MTDPLNRKVAFITGAGSGIGRATALHLAGRGARVAVTDIDPDGAQSTVSQIHDSGGEALLIPLDVTDEAAVGSAVQQTVDHFGTLDCAVNNAGTNGEPGPVAGYSREGWDRVIAINLTGVWLCLQAEIRQMLKSGGGSIVNISSGAGLSGHPFNAPYSASKHGVIGLTRSAAIQYGTDDIRVNAICPGVIETPMVTFTKANPELAEALLKRHALGRFGQPEEVAHAIAYLCDPDASSYITGIALPVDAGYLA
jgi:NAD(P)-dependent dehydrogenase (short-subunit alcohol dehydrogenase family)